MTEWKPGRDPVPGARCRACGMERHETYDELRRCLSVVNREEGRLEGRTR